MKLEVWMEAVRDPVGLLEQQPDRSLRFTYAPGTPPQGRLSMALPITDTPHEGAACQAYFAGLLPEGRERDRIMGLYQIDQDDIGSLFYHLGTDCAGAVSITPPGTGPAKRPGYFPGDYEEISATRLTTIVQALHIEGRMPAGTRSTSLLSGLQPKIALLHHEGRFYLPRPGSRAATTHILKVAPVESPDLARQEAALLRLARSLNLDAVQSDYLTFPDAHDGPDIGAILMRRFDRTFDGRTVQRVHCEDICQALGLMPDEKYGHGAADGFSMFAVGSLARHTARPALFIMAFMRQTLFNLAVGNTENHARNSAILYRGPAGDLAPLYDVTAASLDPHSAGEMALPIGGAIFARNLDLVRMETGMRDLGFAKPRLAGDWAKWSAPIEWSGLNVSAWSVSGLSGRCFRVLVDDIPEHCAV